MAAVLAAILYLGPFVFSIWCIVCVFRNASSGKLYQAQRSYGWLALCTAPIVLAQIVIGFGSISFSDLGQSLAVVPGSWMVLLGGQSVVTIFEDNVKDWTGHRKDTMLDNAHVFLALTAVQVLTLGSLIFWRFRQGKSLRDKWVLGIGIFMVVNAALAMQWMWFGT